MISNGAAMFANLSDGWKTALQIIFVLVLVGAAAALLLSMGLMRTGADSHLVSFEVRATGGFALVTLEAGSESIEEPLTVTSPWTKKVRIKSGTAVYLTASNPSQTGEISCSISLDQNLWKTEATNAPKNGVACAGIVP
jgi:hypothetical protein